MGSKLRLEGLVCFGVVAVLFFPYFPGILPGYLGSNLALVLSGFFAVFCLLFSNMEKPRRLIVFAFFAFLYFCFAILVSSFHDSIRGGSVFGFDLLVELIRPAVIFVVFIFWASFFNSKADRDLWFFQVYLVLAILIALLCFFEVYGGSVSRSLMYLIYKRDYKEIIADKATATFGITYYLAFFLLYPFVACFTKFILEFNFKYLLISVVLLAAAFISQSRTGFIAYLVSMLLSLCLVMFFSGRRGLASAFVFIPVFLGCVGYLYLNMDSLLANFTYLNGGLRFVLEGNVDFSGQDAGSANVRIAQVIYAFDNMRWFGITGSGMAKDGTILLESVYSMYLYRYGFLGIFFFFFIVFICAKSALGKYWKASLCNDEKRRVLYLSLVCYFLVVPLALFSSAMQDAPKLSFFYYALVALCLVPSRFSQVRK